MDLIWVPMEVDDRTLRHADAIVDRHDDTSEGAISEFLAGIDRESFTRRAARDLLAERSRERIDRATRSAS